MKKDYGKKFLYFILILILFYIVGFVVSYFTAEEKDFTVALSSSTTLIVFGVGLLLAMLYCLAAKTPTKSENASFEGKTKSGDKFEQHFNARFITEKELLTNPTFMPNSFATLPKLKKSGVVISTLYKNKNLRINMYPPIHTLIIGTTGSGKTTFMIDPSIRIYAHTAEKPCMVITDPKGELYNNHAVILKQEGYRIITLDLRNPYCSSRWNPMDNSYVQFQRAHHLEDEVKVYKGVNPKTTNNKIISKEYENEWYAFDGIAYPNKQVLMQDLNSKKQSLINEAENELREIASTVVTVESKTDQSWERGAQDFLLGIMLAMLEDSLNPELGMTREKFNFYNLVKIATIRDIDPDNMMGTLKKYTGARDVLSKVSALTTAVVNNAPNTTRSFLGVLQPKISVFQDMGVCYATSKTDISFDDFTDKPTVLFIKVPDEKESRHCIATMCISQCYKKLIETASKNANLQLKRPVYFILDEFANLPKIEKFDSMITVARSRKIFFEVSIQSYSQLDNKYGKECADIIKGNCNIQVFIGTEDQKTREDFSKMCGDITLQVENTSVNKSEKKESDASRTTSTQTVTRPLIEPYELGQLPYDVNIVKIYGQPAIKTQMTQWFKVPLFEKKVAVEEYIPAQYLDENAIRYDVTVRNKLMYKRPSSLDDFDF